MINARYSGIVDNTNRFVFHILGCGAIGSSAATQICRMGGTNFILYDYDVVDIVNIGVSQYNHDDIDKYKVDALTNHLQNINPSIAVDKFNEPFKEYSYRGENDIAILGFDSMDARLEAVTILCRFREAKPKYIIDGRMGAEHYQQYIFDKPSLIKYKKDWYSDEAGSVEPCNAKATSYCSNMSGSFIANAVRKLITNQPYNRKFSFNFPIMGLEKSRMML
tara:strand:+ start:134 stop:796 length:663 start_codon:yes stop_codon:yes gene_type:complete